jgi:large subunit ribosomal protein L22
MTEKNYNPEQKSAKAMQNQSKTPQHQHAPAHQPKTEENKAEEKKEEGKKPSAKAGNAKPKVKREEAIVNGRSIPISTLDSMFIGKFIKRKTIQKAISDLEEVLLFKRAIPMKWEVPHRHGKGMMSGRYPLNAVKQFIKLLKSLQANANTNGIEEPVITEVVPNIAYRPFGRFGRIRRKRTHLRIVAREKSKMKKNKKEAKK